PTIKVGTSGKYVLKVTDVNGCEGKDSLEVNVHAYPTVPFSGNLDTCVSSGYQHVLDAGNPGMAYLWDDQSTAQQRTLSGNGVYSVHITNIWGCRITASINATFR